MKKLTLLVAGLMIAGMSYAAPCDKDKACCKNKSKTECKKDKKECKDKKACCKKSTEETAKK